MYRDYRTEKIHIPKQGWFGFPVYTRTLIWKSFLKVQFIAHLGKLFIEPREKH